MPFTKKYEAWIKLFLNKYIHKPLTQQPTLLIMFMNKSFNKNCKRTITLTSTTQSLSVRKIRLRIQACQHPISAEPPCKTRLNACSFIRVTIGSPTHAISQSATSILPVSDAGALGTSTCKLHKPAVSFSSIINCYIIGMISGEASSSFMSLLLPRRTSSVWSSIIRSTLEYLSFCRASSKYRFFYFKLFS